MTGIAFSDGDFVVQENTCRYTDAVQKIAAIELASGRVTNNRLEMVFEGTSRRSFSYSFKMMPKVRSRTENVDQIVRMFRFYMAPSFEGDLSSSRTMIVPATFDISYYEYE